ncbi:MAG: hypothetical protein ACRDOB_20445, partial [Streptosporangiaceae bacterium]
MAVAATMAAPPRPKARAITGPASAPAKVAAASPVRKAALIRPSTASGTVRWTAVGGMTSAMEPARPTRTAAGNAVTS